jgi:hypothetical protein
MENVPLASMKANRTPVADVRYRRNSGKHLLMQSFRILTLNSHCIAIQILEIQARHALRRMSINKRHKARMGLPCS